MVNFGDLSSLFPADSEYSTRHLWVLLAAATILGLGALTRERLDELVSRLFEEIASESESLLAIRQLREGLLKSGPIVGFPRVSVEKRMPSLAAVLKEDNSLRATVSLADRRSRGRAFFDAVYQKHADSILDNLNKSSGGDLGEFAVGCLYGDLIAETSILGAKETAMLQFVCCLCFGQECEPQAKGHMFGARNLGNTGSEIRAAINAVAAVAKKFNAAWTRENLAFLTIAEDW